MGRCLVIALIRVAVSITAGAKSNQKTLSAFFVNPDDENMIGPVTPKYAKLGHNRYAIIAIFGISGLQSDNY